MRDFEAGCLQEAERAFEASLELLPGRASTLVNLGATKLRLSKPLEALSALDQALARAPGDRDAWCHRCEALGRLGRYEEALASCDKAIAMDASCRPAWQGRARLLTQLRRYEEALIAFDRVAALLPGHGETWQQRGQMLQKLGRHDEALLSYDKALALNPGLAQAWTLRGGILKDQGRVDEAVECFHEALAQGGDAELNGYFLASLVGRDAPSRAPQRYVQSLFDDYADIFDEHLVSVLRYEAHRFLVDNLRGVGPERFGAALDLGCGTGLCGPLIKSAVQRLDGVDLSPGMLDKARALGLYEQLVQGDLVEHLRSTPQTYDLVLSADVFAYVGDLEPVFAGVSRVMNRSALFCFSVEQAGDEQMFQLTMQQRYAHSERYVRQLAARHGFETVKMLRHAIREDQREPIAGLYFYLFKA
ncbi:MAG TPA: tetratricopeptide repeat protein [Burkholderiales bacterium]|nr:tetratricopeptide repeat protein [Burkholderiales bacterium]